MWKIIMLPIIQKQNIRYIVEIGSDWGVNTKNILEYCVENNAHMTAIDPFPKFDVEEYEKEYGDKFEMCLDLSLNQLPLLKDYDCVIIDGDHNWYTVYNELKVIEKENKGKNFPLIFLHDVSWPYARRDLYYNPNTIPEKFRQPFKKLGISMDSDELVEENGMNSHLDNAIKANTLRNGVLTAIEDFMDESDLNLTLNKIPIFHGLGILYCSNNEIDEFIANLMDDSNLLGYVEKMYLKEIIRLDNKILNKQEALNHSRRNENRLAEIRIELNEKINTLQQIQTEQEQIIKNQNKKLKIKEIEISDLKTEINNLNNENENKNKLIESYHNSTSWKVTAPIRKISNLLRNYIN